MNDPESPKNQRFAIFRAADSASLDDSGIMETVMPSEAVLAGVGQVVEAGMNAGHAARVLFAGPGMSLTHVWFKSGFPLPRHAHDSDCLYYILAGSLRLGTEDLRAGDGFFIGAGVPYAYVPGEAGVEVLEFRSVDRFDIRTLATNPAFWTKAAETARAKRDIWPDEPSPSGLMS